MLPHIRKGGAERGTARNQGAVEDRASLKNAQLPEGQASDQVVRDSAQRVLNLVRSLVRFAVCGGRATIRARGFYEVIVACFLL